MNPQHLVEYLIWFWGPSQNYHSITVIYLLDHFPYHDVISETLPCLPLGMLLYAGFSVSAYLTSL